MVADYTNARGAVREHLDEGFRMLGHIDRVISDCKTTAYNRVTMFLAVVAIVVPGIALMV